MEDVCCYQHPLYFGVDQRCSHPARSRKVSVDDTSQMLLREMRHKESDGYALREGCWEIKTLMNDACPVSYLPWFPAFQRPYILQT